MKKTTKFTKFPNDTPKKHIGTTIYYKKNGKQKKKFVHKCIIVATNPRIVREDIK